MIQKFTIRLTHFGMYLNGSIWVVMNILIKDKSKKPIYSLKLSNVSFLFVFISTQKQILRSRNNVSTFSFLIMITSLQTVYQDKLY